MTDTIFQNWAEHVKYKIFAVTRSETNQFLDRLATVSHFFWNQTKFFIFSGWQWKHKMSKTKMAQSEFKHYTGWY